MMRNFKLGIHRDARPQATLLLTAAGLSLLLWFIPFAEILTYPFRLFVTFIHEGGHALAALLTGNTVESLSIATNASGETYTTQGGLFSQMLVSSAGYVGAMIYGVSLLVMIRKAVAARIVLIGSAAFVFLLTAIYGVYKPLVSGAAWSAVPFTFLAGTLLTLGLLAVAKLANSRIASFFVSFLAVQCILNALLDLKTVFFLSAPFGPSVPSDAVNMANATGLPAVIWSSIWIALSVAILFLTMRLYVATRKNASPLELPMSSGTPLLPTELSDSTKKVYGGW
jgi:hypothetical protein